MSNTGQVGFKPVGGSVMRRLDLTDSQTPLATNQRGLAKGKPFCFPSSQRKRSYLLRRFAPGLTWSMVHRTEGR